MMTERGVAVDHATIYRWVQHFAPEMERRLRWQWRWPRSRSWRIDETYVKVRGQWAYLYRALDKLGNTIDFHLSATRNTKAAKRFLGKALNGLKDWELPEVLNTDKAPTYAGAIAEFKAEGKCPDETRHRQVKYSTSWPALASGRFACAAQAVARQGRRLLPRAEALVSHRNSTLAVACSTSCSRIRAPRVCEPRKDASGSSRTPVLQRCVAPRACASARADRVGGPIH